MYSTRGSLILGFHGCHESVIKKVVFGKSNLIKSNNSYDWLGNGTYFWENSPERAMQYAQSIRDKPRKIKHKIKNPAVIGAVIDLGLCLDLVDFHSLQLLKNTYNIVKSIYEKSGFPLPKNTPMKRGKDLLIRKLDCKIIEMLHYINKNDNLREYDSVRGVFFEGEDLYPNAGFKEKNHIQICIRNPNCIKGLFIPRELDNNYILP